MQEPSQQHRAWPPQAFMERTTTQGGSGSESVLILPSTSMNAGLMVWARGPTVCNNKSKRRVMKMRRLILNFCRTGSQSKQNGGHADSAQRTVLIIPMMALSPLPCWLARRRGEIIFHIICHPHSSFPQQRLGGGLFIFMFYTLSVVKLI